MKTVCRIDQCAGCMACMDVCPKGAISIHDSVLSYNAVIDTVKCIDCDACHRVCPQNNMPERMPSHSWYQGWAKDEGIRRCASSGGIATALSSSFIEDGGVVCSCVFQRGEFSFRFVESITEIAQFTGSRYIKSNPAGIYKTLRNFLAEGRSVLFIGLPCQVAAVKNYVEEKFADSLYTVELICHGSPSPKVLNTFLEQKKMSIQDLQNVQFRTKNKFQLRDGKEKIGFPGTMDSYSIAFLNCLSYTENCYSCQYATRERVADITIGDSWGSTLPIEEVRKGISLILCQTRKGESLVARSDLILKEVDLERAIAHNHQLSEPPAIPAQREHFLKSVLEGQNLDRLVRAIYPKEVAKQKLKAILLRLKIINEE